MNHYKKTKDKIHSWESMSFLRKQWKSSGLKVVFTNGCFDLIHLGHIDYLSKSADLGDKLIIAVNSDKSTKKLKGERRPLQDEQSRMMILASFSFVDAVVLFDEDTPYKIIQELLPDIQVKGGDYSKEDVVGADIQKQHGGELVILPYLEGYSTTGIEKKILGEL
ncbi:MAG: D-glycero-beta-D-manno-heptose 1-phosphate adenylyltransferase [Bacteroidetes bacterium]|nr:D-glycero-beta-D-manno-heptose 1-phosphate adenylyltransferase [Bacteroidota bacterium]